MIRSIREYSISFAKITHFKSDQIRSNQKELKRSPIDLLQYRIVQIRSNPINSRIIQSNPINSLQIALTFVFTWSGLLSRCAKSVLGWMELRECLPCVDGSIGCYTLVCVNERVCGGNDDGLFWLFLTPNLQSLALNGRHGGSVFAGFLSLHGGRLRGPIWHWEEWGFGLLGLHMRRSAAYLSSSPRSRHRRHAGWSPEHWVTRELAIRSENKQGV